MPATSRMGVRFVQRHRAASLRRHPVQRPCHKRHFARSRPRTASSARWGSAVPAPRPRAACRACSKRTAACHQSSTIMGRVAKIFGVENYAPSMGALRSDGAISGPSNRFTDLVEGGEQASRRAVRRRFFRALNVCDTPLDWAMIGGPEPVEIDAAFMVAAVHLWREYFLPHSRAALRLIGLSD